MIQILKDKIIINSLNFVAKDIFECGQIFRYKKISSGYICYSLDKSAIIEEIEGKTIISCKDVDYFYKYFDLDTDYNVITNKLSKDMFMAKAVDFGRGIRILRQDLFETIISFIISANNNISRIQKIIENICKAFGSVTEFGYAFPTQKQLLKATASDFKELGCGYRAEYLFKTLRLIDDQFERELKILPTELARKKLLNLVGVGNKVADCILLFGLGRLNTFPCDVWIKKVYHEYFEQGHKDNQISNFFVNYFGELSGYAQQYLFYFQRSGEFFQKV
ncbi:MAG: DNA glycosylase [Clostridia bacterium]